MDRPVLNEQLVRTVLGQQFPKLHVERVRRIEEGGGRTYEVNGGLIFRFASDEIDAAKLRREVALLAEIAPTLPIAVPAYEFARELPYPFFGYQRIGGVSGETHRPPREHWPVIATQFGKLLSALHGLSAEWAQAHGVPKAPEETFGAEYRTKDVNKLLGRLQKHAEVIRRELADLVDDRMARYLAGDVAPPAASQLPPVLCHADLKGEHVILSESADAVVGVIDWSDCCVSDPLLDFYGLMIWLGETFVRQVLRHYTRPVDGFFLQRVCFYARCFALDNLGAWLTTAWDAPLELLKTQVRWAFSEA